MLFDEEFDDEPTIEAEGLLPPRETDLFIGHETIEEELLHLINNNNLPHALIFAGPEGIGKATFAYRLTRYLLTNGVKDSSQDSLFGEEPPQTATSLDIDADNPIFSKVASGGHPDLLTIEKSVDPRTKKEKKGIDVETARKVLPFLRMTSSEGGWRIVILDNADTMNNNAQNALLKILEEPPKNTLLILICHRPSAMISTIRSRCRMITFAPLNDADFNSLLDKEYAGEFSDSQKQLLLTLSNSQFGRVKKIVDHDGLENVETIMRLFNTAPNFNIKDIHQLADTIGRAGQEKAFDVIASFFNTYFQEIITAKAKNKPVTTIFESELTNKLTNERSLQELLDMQEKVKDLFAQTVFANLDKRICMINVFSALK